jgi:hypothetical protein
LIPLTEVMMKYLAIVLSTMLLMSCASIQPKPFKGPGGGEAYSMRCSGLGRTLHDCYQKAGELCPDGYNLIDITSGSVGVPQSGGGMLMARRDDMAVECK